MEKIQGADCFEMDVITAGWSETVGPDSYLLRTMEATPTPAWQIVDTGGVLLTPSNAAIFAEVNETLFGPRAPAVLDDKDLVRVPELQRGHVEPYGPNGIPTSLVGGFLQVTSVTGHEISTRIIHRWADQVGMRIDACGGLEKRRA